MWIGNTLIDNEGLQEGGWIGYIEKIGYRSYDMSDIDGLTENITGINNNVTAINNNITPIKTNVTNLQSNITSINTNITNINSNITGLKTSDTNINSSITNVSNNVTNINNNIINISGNITTLQGSVGNIPKVLARKMGRFITTVSNVTNSNFLTVDLSGSGLSRMNHVLKFILLYNTGNNTTYTFSLKYADSMDAVFFNTAMTTSNTNSLDVLIVPFSNATYYRTITSTGTFGYNSGEKSLTGLKLKCDITITGSMDILYYCLTMENAATI
jgi:archaellum component FlaC